MSFQVSIAVSNKKDPQQAIEEVFKKTSKEISEPQLALMFGSIFYDNEKLVEALSQKIDKSIIVGCSSFYEISNAGVTSGSVVLALLSGSSINIKTTGLEGTIHESGDFQKMVDNVSKSLNPVDSLIRRIGLFFRGAGDGSEDFETKQFQKLLSPIVMFGGRGTGNYNLPLTHEDYFLGSQYSNGSANVQNKSLSVFEYNTKQIQASFGFSHGWTRVGRPVTITKAIDSEVFEVDGVSIFDYYKKYLGQAHNSNFFSKLIQRYGFRLVSDEEDYEHSLVKIPVYVHFDKGSVVFFPKANLENKRVEMVQASKDDLLAGARCAAKSCLKALDGKTPDFMIMISCCVRTDILLSNIDHEVKAIQEVFEEEFPIIGYYAGGELGPLHSDVDVILQEECASGGSYNHATSVVLLAFRAKDREVVEVSYPTEKACYGCIEDENQNLKELIKKYEDNFDTTVSILNNISRENYLNIDEIEEQNTLLEQKNETLNIANIKNNKLQELVRRYTPHSIWKTANKLVDLGKEDFQEEKLQYCFLFLDVKGFTAYSEKNSPEEVVRALNEIFTPSTEVIYQNHGDIDKFIGDCIFAFFPNAENAIHAAIQIHEIMDGIKDSPFQIRMGVHEGNAVRANVGSSLRKEYTFIGDSVNLAQRLEAACDPGYILMSEGVYRQNDTKFSEVRSKTIRVKGKQKEILVYQCKN
ncbi:MAG: FIST C-terminal domain-containing protein [Candidatus Cloacimonetes bacterium]|nr:FIST C-terminal domain-containing protein [Candidatus Cloacimonadota bacterium]